MTESSEATREIVKAIGDIASRIETRVDSVERDLSALLRKQQDQLVRLDERLKNYDTIMRRVDALETSEQTRRALDDARTKQTQAATRVWGLIMSIPSAMIALGSLLWVVINRTSPP